MYRRIAIKKLNHQAILEKSIADPLNNPAKKGDNPAAASLDLAFTSLHLLSSSPLICFSISSDESTPPGNIHEGGRAHPFDL